MAIARRNYNENTNSTQAPEGLTSAYLSGGQTFRIEQIDDYAEKRHRRFVLLQSFLIYLPLSILLGFTLYSELRRHDTISLFLVVLTIIAGVLVTARYLLATEQNDILLPEQERQLEQAERLSRFAADSHSMLNLHPH